MEDKFAEINKLKTHIVQILSMYEDNKEENTKLVFNNNKLKDELSEKNNYIKNIEKKIEILQFAKTISLTEKDKDVVVKKINKIIKDIDTSIGLLNE